MIFSNNIWKHFCVQLWYKLIQVFDIQPNLIPFSIFLSSLILLVQQDNKCTPSIFVCMKTLLVFVIVTIIEHDTEAFRVFLNRKSVDRISVALHNKLNLFIYLLIGLFLYLAFLLLVWVFFFFTRKKLLVYIN